jgi:hypothetical protein
MLTKVNFTLMRKPRRSQPATELLRLPIDVSRAIRRRAAAFDITLAEAARQLMQPKEVKHHLGLLDHVTWLQDRLEHSRGEVEKVLKQEGGDPKAVARAIAVLGDFVAQWPDDSDEGYDFAAFGMGQPQ